MLEDLRFALRLLTRDRGFAVTAILVLAVGIGVNNMMFTLIYSHTLRGLPIDRPDRVLYISTLDSRFPDRPLSAHDFADLRAEARSFAAIAAFFNAPVTVGDRARSPDRVDGTYLSADAMPLVGASPSLGRAFSVDDDRQGAEAVAILGSRLWRSRYGADAAILGRSILINGAPATVVGIMPDPSGFPSTAEVWLPLSQMPGFGSSTREQRNLRVIGRLRDGVTITNARAEVAAVVDRIATNNPETSRGLRGEAIPIHNRYFGRATDTAWLAFMTAGFLIVVVSCANVANLMLARSVVRAREIAIRGSLGATRRRIASQVLMEAVVLAVVGGTAGLAVSRAGVLLFRSGIPDNAMPYWSEYSMDWRVFGALVLISFASAVVFGLVPALQASQTDANRVLKESGPMGIARTRRLTTAFLAAEFALTVVLLAQVVVSLRNRESLVHSDSFIDTPAVLAASLTLSGEKYRAPDQRLEFYRLLVERLRGLPGLVDVSLAATLPLRGATEQRLEVDGRSRQDAEQLPAVWTVVVGSRYFRTLGLQLERGTDFSDQDGGPGQPNVIVNRRFVELFLPGADPIGRRIRVTSSTAQSAATRWLTIAGVAPDIRQRPTQTPDPIVYLPPAGAPPASSILLVRSTLTAAATATLLRGELLSLDPNLPLYQVMTMHQAIEEANWVGRVSHRLIVMLTVLAMGLSIVGLYAVTAHAVGQRTREIGIRMALGARVSDIRRLIAGRAIFQVALGLLLGIAGAIVWSALFSTGRVDLSFAMPSVLIPVSGLLALVTFVACLIPLRHAARLDPVVALRQD